MQPRQSQTNPAICWVMETPEGVERRFLVADEFFITGDRGEGYHWYYNAHLMISPMQAQKMAALVVNQLEKAGWQISAEPHRDPGHIARLWLEFVRASDNQRWNDMDMIFDRTLYGGINLVGATVAPTDEWNE